MMWDVALGMVWWLENAKSQVFDVSILLFFVILKDAMSRKMQKLLIFLNR